MSKAAEKKNLICPTCQQPVHQFSKTCKNCGADLSLTTYVGWERKKLDVDYAIKSELRYVVMKPFHSAVNGVTLSYKARDVISAPHLVRAFLEQGQPIEEMTDYDAGDLFVCPHCGEASVSQAKAAVKTGDVPALSN